MMGRSPRRLGSCRGMKSRLLPFKPASAGSRSHGRRRSPEMLTFPQPAEAGLNGRRRWFQPPARTTWHHSDAEAAA